MPSHVHVTQNQFSLVLESIFCHLNILHSFPTELHFIVFKYYEIFEVFWDKTCKIQHAKIDENETEVSFVGTLGSACIRAKEPIPDGSIVSWKIEITEYGRNGADAFGVVSNKTPINQYLTQTSPWYNQQETKSHYQNKIPKPCFDNFYGDSTSFGLYYGTNMGNYKERGNGHDVKHLKPKQDSKWNNFHYRRKQTFLIRADFTQNIKKIRIVRFPFADDKTLRKYIKIGWEELDFTFNLPNNNDIWYPCATLWADIKIKVHQMTENEWEPILKQL